MATLDLASATWGAFGVGLPYYVVALAASANGMLVAGGNVNSIGRVDIWNGSSWTQLAILDGHLSSLAFLPNGDVVVGGTFIAAGGVSANNVARWDGSSWNSLGGGLNGEVLSLAIGLNGNLVAGAVPFAPMDPALAEWDGSDWIEIGPGIEGQALAVNTFQFLDNGDIIAGGTFFWNVEGNPTLKAIARWDGSDWIQLGSGIESAVASVAQLLSGDIVAAGYFTSAGGVSANNVARWNGAKWLPIGDGLGVTTIDQVHTLTATPACTLFAGGAFPENLASTNLGGAAPGTAFCFGDGSGANCPCGNTALTTGQGCLHSGGRGMTICSMGTASISSDDLVLIADGCPTGNAGIYFSGKTSLDRGTSLFDGLQCVGGSVRRYQPLFQSNGIATDTAFVAQDPTGTYFNAAETVNFQYWSRDAAGSPCGTGANFSPGYAVTMAP